MNEPNWSEAKTTRPMPVPCRACGNQSGCVVWEVPVCYPCYGDWRAHAPNCGDIEDKYGKEADAAPIYLEFTQRWLSARKGRAA